ncbi:MAG: AMP-binding protein, partial [Gammaproteobacteria bacterium]|nr:AMP-binding protein [Gammaproteobacteria bacterium]
MEAPWIQAYGDNIPATIDPDRYPHYVAMLDEACAAFSEHVAFRNFDAPLTYADTDRLSRDFAAWLQQDAGITKGDRVAVMMPNMPAFAVAMFGILRAGGVQVNVNPLYTPRELQHQLSDADVETIVVYSGSTPALAEIIADTPVTRVIVTELSDMMAHGLPSPPPDSRLTDALRFSDALAAGGKLLFEPVALSGNDLMFLQYTGGTTGLSKGAMLTHRNIVANILQYEAMARDVLRKGDDIVMTAIPMYHIFALTVNTLAHFYFGAENILITDPKDMSAFAEEWCKRPVTVFTAVNTLFNGLNNTPRFADADFSQLRICVGGGAP